jgi:extracellular factor (EF) 3-hydroxypalmitic acid methyl ester biosynthesis protein
VVCEASLEEASWRDVEFNPAMSGNGHLRAEFAGFLKEWQKLYRVADEYKLIIADMQTFFMDLRLWLDQVELGVRSAPSGDRLQLEQGVAGEVAAPVLPAMDDLFERFETVAGGIEAELLPAHRSYMRRQLHPLVMCAPFAHRAFYKPLGYAGDYELVNMMARNAYEGSSLFAKVVNTWFLQQPPAQAHRNRLRYLVEHLTAETLRAQAASREARIFNVACGPAQEVGLFVSEQPLSNRARFSLLDFNVETLQYTRATLTEAKMSAGRSTPLNFIKKSVHQLIKESGRMTERSFHNQYDFVYCAGLFDYLSDQVCQRLMNLMYEWVAPGGLLVATNVEPGNPLRHGMEHLLDWHLIYRNGPQMGTLKPQSAAEDDTRVCSDDTGVNVFIEVRKPRHA